MLGSCFPPPTTDFEPSEHHLRREAIMKNETFVHSFTSRPVSRRTALRGFAVAGLGLGATLVGCSSGSSKSSSSKPPAEGPPEVAAIRLPQTPNFCDSGQFLAEKYL